MYTYKPAKQNTEKTKPHVLAKSSPLYTQPAMQRMADNCTIKLNADKLVQRKGNALLDDYLARQAVVQREEVPEEEEVLQGKFADTAQREELDEEELLQGKFETTQRKENAPPNKTGLPDNLKSGIENLSGHSMDDVRVHYNSPKPAQLQALAYTQGTNIHVASGQEKHLPHEAWHVVQQMQGRVQPTMQMQGISINNDETLESEADMIGEKFAKNHSVMLRKKNVTINDTITQRVIVRVGYNEGKAKDSNPFISGSHKVLETETNKLGKPAMPLFDYLDETKLREKEKGRNRKDLYILGHGKPGFIAGIHVDTLAENTKKLLEKYEFKEKIENIHLHSCFSNVKEGGDDTLSARDAFGKVFSMDYIQAAPGLLYSGDHHVLPQKYMGVKLGASFAKKALIDNKAPAKLYEPFLECTCPFEVLLQKTFAAQTFSFDNKSENNSLPQIEDKGIDSIKAGLDNTLGVIKNEQYLGENQKTEFTNAHQKCIENFTEFKKLFKQNSIKSEPVKSN